ncbi:YbjN domain-containing protein [Bradyrhizobium sp. dw_411]|uniref:YbjN domain-containing protein n=1 Tax=Bradyrhizobium sp. dw_411 TaxID=2720082 RepID=UPI001BCC75A6|nr:YbjN domain-containing protein [Bradyrhizobium sp. dw_411]
MSDAIISKLTLDHLRDAFQQAGYRVEMMTDPVANTPYLRSATSGLAFDIRPGNRMIDDAASFADVAFTAVLRVQGELPLEIVNRWNAERRFARLQLSAPFLVFCMDVSVVGGVAPGHFRSQIEIWDRLLQDFVAYLREELRKLVPVNGANAPAAVSEPQPAKIASPSVAEADQPATIQ